LYWVEIFLVLSVPHRMKPCPSQSPIVLLSLRHRPSLPPPSITIATSHIAIAPQSRRPLRLSCRCPSQYHRHCCLLSLPLLFMAIAITIVPLSHCLLCCHCYLPLQPAANVAISHCDICCHPLPPPTPTAIAPSSHRPLRCCSHCLLQPSLRRCQLLPPPSIAIAMLHIVIAPPSHHPLLRRCSCPL
jgi:hypothetical protein